MARRSNAQDYLDLFVAQQAQRMAVLEAEIATLRATVVSLLDQRQAEDADNLWQPYSAQLTAVSELTSLALPLTARDLTVLDAASDN